MSLGVVLEGLSFAFSHFLFLSSLPHLQMDEKMLPASFLFLPPCHPFLDMMDSIPNHNQNTIPCARGISP